MTRSAEPPRRALVTGAGGFIGRHLTRHLLEVGWRVTALDLDLTPLRSSATDDRCRLLEADLCDADARKRALEDTDTVFHLAAAHLGALEAAEVFERVNVEATRALAAASLEAGIGRFVHCSSVGVYGRIEHPPANEETPCHPQLPYEKTKLAGEGAILELVAQGALPAVILRPVWVYGADDSRTVKLFRAIEGGRFLLAGRGDTFRHCIFIDDMVSALMLAATRPLSPGEIFVIGDERAVTIRQLLDEIAGLTDSPPPRSIPLPLMHGVAATAELVFRALGKEPPISRRSMRFFTGNTAFDTSKATQQIAFVPANDLREGLQKTRDELVRAGVLRPTAASVSR